MTQCGFDTHWITPQSAHLLDRVAPGTFDHAIEPTRLGRYLANPANWMCIAMEGDLVVSMCMCVVHDHPDKPSELFLDEIGTGDDWRRKGAAWALMQKVFERAEAEGIEEIWLATEPDNLPARSLYEATGAKSEPAISYFLEW